MTWTRHPASWPASRALVAPGARLTWSTWDGAWVAWLPEVEEIHESAIRGWCDRHGLPAPTVADLAWLSMEDE